MKMIQSDYRKLSKAILALPIDSILRDCKELRYSEMATRWTLFHQANTPQEFPFRHLNDYLNDDHIDTALRKIVREL